MKVESDDKLRIDALRYHELGRKGKIEVIPTKPHDTQRDLALAYSPGVAEPCLEIQKDEGAAYKYTAKGNLVAVITNGTAVLGLGDIGAMAAKPVMEGKGLLFKIFADIDVFDIEIDEKDPEKFIQAVKAIAPTFGGINLEDIKAPDAFEIERRLKEELDIPVMHDDQHGTAVVVLAALKNALRVVDKDLETAKIVITGAGAAGIAVAEILLSAGAHDLVVIDSKGALHTERDDIAHMKLDMAQRSNPRGVAGGTAEALHGADVFIGVSSAKVAESEIAAMAEGAIVFALSNPDPEVDPAVAGKYAAVVATGRSDFPNQINNVLAFPGIFRGALDAGARRITLEMKLAAAQAIADLVAEPRPELIVPNPFTPGVAEAVAQAVMDCAAAEK